MISRFVSRAAWFLLVLGAASLSRGAGPASQPTPVNWSGDKLVLMAEQSAGGVIVNLADGTRGVALDKTCELPWPNVTRIEWKVTPSLPAGWWHGGVDFSAREGDDRGWVNRELGVVLQSPGKPLANMMLNFHPPEGKAPARFEFWTYIASPAEGVHLQDVYAGLYKWKRTWPILRVTLERAEPPAWKDGDVVALDLPVRNDASVDLPGALPAGLWSLRAAMTKEGDLFVEGADGRTIHSVFSFDRWRRPDTLHWYSASPVKKLVFRTRTLFKSVVLENSLVWPAKSLATDRQLMTTVDPARRQSATLELIGDNLAPDAPALTVFPGGNKNAVLTTWDDGETTDLRLAEILSRLGYHPTFFLVHDKPAVKSMEKLESMGAEIGSHCWNHPFLYILPPDRAAEECAEMRKFLESELKHPVISFAYPNGYAAAYDTDGDYVLRAVRAAGYWSGRTTAGAAETVDSIDQPLTLKTNGFFGDRKGLEKVWEETRAKPGGVFAFWGHSWQIGKTDEQWKDFEQFVAKFARQPDAWYASQGELMLWIWSRKNVQIAVSDCNATKMTVKLTRPWLHPWLASKCPLTLQTPAGVRKALWNGKEIPVRGRLIELNWPGD